MPIKFRCEACRGRLSIARRKAGTKVECPQCRAQISVPIPSPDDVLREVESKLNLETAAAVAMKTEAGTSEVGALRQESGSERNKSATVDEAASVTTKNKPPTAKRVRRDPREIDVDPSSLDTKSNSAVRDEDPLFENPNFERFLEPSVRQAILEKEESPLTGKKEAPFKRTNLKRSDEPAPETGRTSETARTSSRKIVTAPETEPSRFPQGFFISYVAAALFGGLIFFLITLSFAVGFLLGRW